MQVLAMACRQHLGNRQPAKALAALQDGLERSRILSVFNLPLANGSSTPGTSPPTAAASVQQLRLAILAGAITCNDEPTVHQVSG